MNDNLNPATIGILMMDARIKRIPGDVGNPATFPFPVHLRTVAGATLKRLIHEGDRSLLKPFVEAGWALVGQGIRALTTTCGFMILFQEDLAREFPVPVFTSSLLQLPFIQASLRPQDRIGIITADASNLTQDHLCRAGGNIGRITVVGLDCGACGYPDCKSLEQQAKNAGEFSGPICAFRLLDMGIALGSAVKTASMLNVDNRIMYRIGTVARETQMVDWDFVMGIPLAATGKNIFFDR
jgi:hypothetical protein